MGILVVILHYIFWKEDLISAHPLQGLHLETVLGGIGSLVCIISFIYPAAFLWVLYSKTKHLPFNITSEKGKLIVSSITILCCAMAMTFCVVLML